MASNIAIVASATSYAFYHHPKDGNGVVLGGPLGSINVHESGRVTEASVTKGDWDHPSYTASDALREAIADAAKWLKKANALK